MPRGGRSSVSRPRLVRAFAAPAVMGQLAATLPPVAGSESGTAPSTTFDFYIGPSGSDSNPGTLASPWAITALGTKGATYTGKRVGLLDGTYTVESPSGFDSTIQTININGGSSSAQTVIAAVNPRQATINNYANGYYGGGLNRPSAALAHRHSSSNVGYLTIQGLRFTGFSYSALMIGTVYNSTPMYGIIVKDCEFTGGNAAGNSTTNCPTLQLGGTRGALVQNNYFHDNDGITAHSTDHFNSIIGWQYTYGTIIENNTFVHAGSIYGKEQGLQGTIIRYNYIDSSYFTDSNGSVLSWDGATSGGSFAGLTDTTKFHNNIVITGGPFGIEGRSTWSTRYGYGLPIEVYNNTVVVSGGSPWGGILVNAQVANVASIYNNIVSITASGAGYGAMAIKANGPAILDYNLYPSSMKWQLLDSSGYQLSSYTSLASFQSAVTGAGGNAGLDAHSIQSGSFGFVATGSGPAYYQLSGSSPALNAGKSDGTSGGSAVDMGAWGNGATAIGCDF